MDGIDTSHSVEEAAFNRNPGTEPSQDPNLEEKGYNFLAPSLSFLLSVSV